jgi:hypothetical protein
MADPPWPNGMAAGSWGSSSHEYYFINIHDLSVGSCCLSVLVQTQGQETAFSAIVEFPRFWRVGEEKSDILEPGGFHGHISADLHARIQTTSRCTL